ncbi:MAG TPA: hypothetical protein VGI78_02360 [Acetobacteraceae bacterium]|jgi:hypothetical protein
MSGYANISAMPDNTLLYNAASGGTMANVAAQQIQNQQNQLMNPLRVQAEQQQLGQNEMDVMGRAALGVLNLPDDQQPAAYQAAVQGLQAQGFAKNAPPQYPGKATLQQFLSQSMPVAQQYQYGVVTAPGLQSQIDTILGRNTGTGTATGTGTGTGAGDINSLPKAQFLQAVAQRESGGDPTALNYVAKADPSAYDRGATASGKYQMVNSTWQQAAQWAGVDTGKYPTARSAPEAVQDQVASALYDHSGTAPWQKGSKDWVRGPGGQYTMQTVQPTAPGLYSPLRGGPQSQPGGPGTPAPYQVASNVPVPPPGSTPAASPASAGVVDQGELPGAQVPVPPAATPLATTANPPQARPQQGATTDLNGPRPLPTPSTAPNLRGGTPAQTPAQIANTPMPTPAIPQPPVNQIAPGAQNGAPVQQPPAQAPAAATANLPHAADVPSGVNSPQYQKAMELQRQALALESVVDPTGRAKAIAAGLRQQAALSLQADNVVQTQEGQMHTLTGAMEKPVPHYATTLNPQGAYVDTSGSSPPVTPPSPRLTTGPGGVVLQSKPGGGAEVVYSPPAGLRPATADYDQQAKAYADDKERMPAISTSAQTAQSGMMRLNELANIIPQLATGPTSELRARGAAWLEQLGASPETIKTWTGMQSGSLAEELIKLSVATVGQAAKADLGSNVGIQSLQLYQSANPGISLLPDANKRMTNMARVSAQMTQDYAQGAQQHFNENQASFLSPDGRYTHPLSEYDQQWQQRNNPHIGAGAMGILNGDSFDKWALRVTPEEAKQAVAMAYRIDPTTMVPTAKGLKPAADILGVKNGG